MNIRPISATDTLPVRHQVLWPSKPAAFCRVDGDDTAHHFGYFVADELVAVASIFIDGDSARLRKFATLPAHQGQGIGSALLHHILHRLGQQPIRYFWCDARLTAANFYKRFGLRVESEPFDKSGVLYCKMGRAMPL